MNKKDQKRHMAYEALVLLGMLALLTFICRLWPILLLIILGIFAAVIRLLFLSSRKIEVRHKITKTGQVVGKYIRQRYGQSKDIQFIYGCPIAPIGSVQHKKPMSKKRTINSYTPEGRAEIHDGLKLNMSILLQLMKTSTPTGSVEFMDNRLSLWCAQYGKCAITGRELMVDEIHCHHKIPKGPGR